jgi:putative tricarboxylic transport membrane protein
MFVLVLVAAPLAEIALKFGTWEIAALVLLGLSLMAFVSSRSILKGMISGVFGLLLQTIGMDPGTAYSRFTFESADLLGGLGLVPVMIGFFGIAEVLSQLEKYEIYTTVIQKLSGIVSVFTEVLRHPVVLFRSSLIGVLIGAIPGTGPAISSTSAYAISKRFSKRKKEFGTGIMEGVVASESANNACVGGALIPTLTLGIPGDAITAVLLGALMFHGVTPGPLLFVENPVFISSIFISLTLSSFIILLFGLDGAPARRLHVVTVFDLAFGVPTRHWPVKFLATATCCSWGAAPAIR